MPSLNMLRRGTRGEPLLLLHGLGGNAHWWDGVAGSLAADFRIAALDFRGHGDSEWAPDGAYGLDSFLEDIESARERLGWERFHLAAHSMGARIALSYARLHAERVERLVAVDFKPEFGPRMLRRYGLALRLKQPLYPTLEEMLPRFRLEPPGTVLDAPALERLARLCARKVAGGFTWKFDWRVFRLLYPPVWPELPGIRAPSLIVYGDKSAVMSEDDARKVAAAIPGARTAAVAGAHHHVPLDAPQELAALMRSFLASASEIRG